MGEHRLLFAFNGGTGGWPGMGRALYRRLPAFRESIDASSAVVEEMLGCSPARMFRGEDETAPAIELERRNGLLHLGLLQIAQIDLWRSEGITPAGVLCVSMGEMTSPYAAGVLTRHDTARVLAALLHAVTRKRARERVFILGTDAASAQRLCRSAPAPVTFIGSTTAHSAVVLCREDDAAALRTYFGALVTRDMGSEWSWHTPRIEVDRPFMAEQLRDLKSTPALLPRYSAAAGGLIPADAPFDVQFLFWMVAHPFHFFDATTAAMAVGFDVIVNIGSQPTFDDAHRAQHPEIRFIDSMRQGDDWKAWRRAVAEVQSLRFVAREKRARATARTVNFNEPRVRSALFDVYEELRREGNVVYVQQHALWLILGFDEVQRALGDPTRFSSASPRMQATDPVLLGSDPPEHTAVRQLLLRHFSAEAVARRTELAARISEELLQPLADGDPLDVVRGLADPLAYAIAADVVGLDAETAATFVEPILAAHGETFDVYAQLEEPFARAAPRASLYAELRRDAHGTLDDAAARSVVRLLWVAATTTKRVLPAAVLLLLQHDDLRKRVEVNPEQLGAFVDEVIRLRPPEHVIPRITTEDVELGGVTIPRGARVHLCLAAANRDPARFPDPAVIQLDRAFTANLSFGAGVHRCLGAAAARGQLIAALRALFRIAPRFRALQPLATIRYQRAAPLRELEQLVIAP